MPLMGCKSRLKSMVHLPSSPAFGVQNISRKNHRMSNTFNKNRKYVLTDKTATFPHPRWQGREVTVHRIKATRDIPEHNVIAGQLGGWIESEHNLTQGNNAWVADEGKVFDNAVCMVNALVTGNAMLYEYAVHRGSSTLTGDAQQYGYSQTGGNSSLGGYTHIAGGAMVSGTYRDIRDITISAGTYTENPLYASDEPVSQSAYYHHQ